MESNENINIDLKAGNESVIYKGLEKKAFSKKNQK